MKELEEAIRKKIDLRKGRSRELWRGFNMTEAVVTLNSKGEVELTVYKWKDENKNELVHKSYPLPSYSFLLDLLDAFKKQEQQRLDDAKEKLAKSEGSCIDKDVLTFHEAYELKGYIKAKEEVLGKEKP